MIENGVINLPVVPVVGLVVFWLAFVVDVVVVAFLLQLFF
jgi:hypothetical protein